MIMKALPYLVVLAACGATTHEPGMPATDDFASVMAGTLPPPEFFAPDNIGRIMAQAGAKALCLTVDVPTFVGMSASMLAVGLLASYVPARRASKVDPIESLRGD